MSWSKIILFSVSVIVLCDGYKILGILSIPSKSHYSLARKLFSEIANRGHEVTFITPYAQQNPIKNLEIIPLESLQELFQGMVSSVLNQESETPMGRAIFLNQIYYNLTKFAYAHENFQKLLKSKERYDAVIVYYVLNEGFFPIAQHFKAPLILFKSLPMFPSDNIALSHSKSSCCVPNLFTEYTGRMNFWQRLRNFFYDVGMMAYYQWVMLPKHRKLAHESIPGSPELYDFLNNESLLLINTHGSTNEVIPMVPNAIEIGGFHIEEIRSLPEDMKKFLDDSINGVILFSMGSISRSANIPKEKRNVFIETFSKLKENVLWKFEEDLEGLPKNVKIMKWIPQSDVLAHPNVRLFLSHGGLLSTMESVYHGVPIVGIPIFCDQHMNMAVAASHEYAVKVSYSQLNEKSLTQALNKVLHNPKYRENIRKRSEIMRDRPIKPLDNALYWIEYVIRHKGAPHLKYSGIDLNWFQRNLLDIVILVIVATVAPFAIFGVILKRISIAQSKRKRD